MMDCHSNDDATMDLYNKEFFKGALECGLHITDPKIVSFKLEKTIANGENYCSNIYRALICYKSSEQLEEIALIVKSMPLEKQGMLRKLNVFGKENLFYQVIKPKLETLMWQVEEEEAVVPWILGAKYIFCITQPEQTIILEDLCKHGFQMESRQLGLDEAHAMQVLKKLAQYHALTMVMALKDPQTIVNNFQYGLINEQSIKTPAFKTLFGAQLLKLATIAADWPGYAEIAQKLHKYHENFSEKIAKSIYPMQGAINVLNHGDIWTNNILFRSDYDNSQQLDVRFIDFQLGFYGSPGFDLIYFFNTSVQLKVLENRREALIENYYRVLCATLDKLRIFGLEPPTLDAIQREIRAREAYGFFVAFGLFPLMSMAPLDCEGNSLDNFHNTDFAAKKIDLMFRNNLRTLEMLKYILRSTDALGILD